MSAQDGNKSNKNPTVNNPSITGSQVNNRGVNETQSESLGSIGDTSLSIDNNLRILYITFAIIIGLLLLWIIIVVVTKEDPLKILGEMNNLATQIPPVSDNKSSSQSQLPISNDTVIVPEGYVNNSSISVNNNTPPPI